jgi:hypothetical protein
MPDLFPFTHHTHIKIPVLKEKFIFWDDLRSTHDNDARGEVALDLSCQREASFYIPLITTHAHEIRLGIQQEFENRSVTSIRHQMAWQKLGMDSLLPGYRLEVGRSQGDVFMAEKEVMRLKGKL